MMQGGLHTFYPTPEEIVRQEKDRKKVWNSKQSEGFESKCVGWCKTMVQRIWHNPRALIIIQAVKDVHFSNKKIIKKPI